MRLERGYPGFKIVGTPACSSEWPTGPMKSWCHRSVACTKPGPSSGWTNGPEWTRSCLTNSRACHGGPCQGTLLLKRYLSHRISMLQQLCPRHSCHHSPCPNPRRTVSTSARIESWRCMDTRMDVRAAAQRAWGWLLKRTVWRADPASRVSLPKPSKAGNAYRSITGRRGQAQPALLSHPVQHWRRNNKGRLLRPRQVQCLRVCNQPQQQQRRPVQFRAQRQLGDHLHLDHLRRRQRL